MAPPADKEAVELKVALTRIETLLSTHLDQQAIINTRLQTQNERHARFIYGSDDSSNPGARVRMDRLEQAEKRRSFIATTALGAVLIMWVQKVWHMIGGGPHS